MIEWLKTTGLLSIYLPFIITILCAYIFWLGSYTFEDEYNMTFLIIITGIMYILALLLSMSEHTYIGTSMICIAFILAIAIMAVSGMKQKDGTQGSYFLCLGIVPFICAFCFTSVATLCAVTSR